MLFLAHTVPVSRNLSPNPRDKRRLIVILLAGQERPRKAGFSGCGDSRNYVS